MQIHRYGLSQDTDPKNRAQALAMGDIAYAFAFVREGRSTLVDLGFRARVDFSLPLKQNCSSFALDATTSFALSDTPIDAQFLRAVNVVQAHSGVTGDHHGRNGWECRCERFYRAGVVRLRAT